MKLISALMILTFIFPQVCSATAGKYSLGGDGRFAADQGQSTISEFVYQNDPNEILIKVYLLGAVSKPGLYHIPVNTDLVSLLAFAGGPLKEAELNHIQVKHRPSTGESNTSDLDLSEVVSSSKAKIPTLTFNDVVLVPDRKPTISPDTVATIGVVATVVGMILTGILVNQALKK